MGGGVKEYAVLFGIDKDSIAFVMLSVHVAESDLYFTRDIFCENDVHFFTISIELILGFLYVGKREFVCFTYNFTLVRKSQRLAELFKMAKRKKC